MTTKITPVNYGYPQSYFNNVPPTVQAISQVPAMITGANRYIELSDLYSQKELRDIISKIGTNAPQLPNQINYVPRYSIQFYPQSETLVIDNMTMTNDTTEILNNGSVRHVGSWHNKEVAPAGTCTDIIEEAKSRMNANNVSS